MTPEEFEAGFNRKAQEVLEYIKSGFPSMAEKKILRFIDGNFRAQGWQGATFQPWKKTARGGTILIKSGNLRRSIHSIVSPGEVYVFTNAPYAGVHNRGFNGTVTVKGHTRNKYTKIKVGTGRYNKNGTERMRSVHVVSESNQIKAHTRHMNIPKRQFMPENINDSPILFMAIQRDIIKEFQLIFNQP